MSYESAPSAQLRLRRLWRSGGPDSLLGAPATIPPTLPPMDRTGLEQVRHRGAAAVWGSLLALAITGAASAQLSAPMTRVDSTGTLVGIIVTKEGEIPLSYGIVSVASLGRERFTDDRGEFRLFDVPVGPLQLQVRHLGYTPVSVTTTVHASRTDTIRVRLAHIAVQLTAMRVRAYPPCSDPGPPTAEGDSSFATLFDQLRLNAEQYRLLASAYPFELTVERMMFQTLVNQEVRVEAVDTLTLRSADHWTYRPGGVVSQMVVGSRRPRMAILNIPTLVHFADDLFLANHCFFDGGEETVDGFRLLRIDFVAASRIKKPDVDGSVYLDPTSFQIRRSFLHVTKMPRGITGVLETDATTVFSELFPSVPVISGISSVNRVDVDRTRAGAVATANEDQRLIRVRFLARRPGDDPKKP